MTDPWGNIRGGFAAVAEIDREDFGLTWNQVLEGGGVLVGKKIVDRDRGRGGPAGLSRLPRGVARMALPVGNQEA